MSMGPIVFTPWRKTGRRAYRRGWFGRPILIMEEECRSGLARPCKDGDVQEYPTPHVRWRDVRWDEL